MSQALSNAIKHLNAAAELLWQMHSDHPHAGAIADRVTLAIAQLDRMASGRLSHADDLDLTLETWRKKELILDAVTRYGATPDTSPDVIERLAEVDVAIDNLIETISW